ncbi:MAG TPA: hypothetical protein VMS60_15880 [Solirubrobacterales bacterium]|nr:hypothetical protein [Solirubrobacterales bacterium]
MTYLVTSDHVESLRGGRMVGPGEVVSDAVAKENQRLIDRGRLVKQASTRKSSDKGESSSAAGDTN